MNLDQIIRAVQEALGVNADGKPGPETWQAIYNRICPDAQPPEPSGDKVDDRSERVIATLLPEVQPYARALIAKAAASGIVIKLLSGSPKYKAVGVLGTDLGLEWGGNWKTIQDEPHFQLRPKWASDLSERDMLADLRSRKDSGQGVYV